MALFPQQFHANDLVWYNIPLWTNQDFMVKAVIVGTPTKYYQGEYVIELEDGKKLTVTEDLLSKREKE